MLLGIQSTRPCIIAEYILHGSSTMLIKHFLRKAGRAALQQSCKYITTHLKKKKEEKLVNIR